MRVLLVTGKGGVGKTTTAAATALAAADRGARTLVMSTDPAHSLADAFEADLGDDVRPVADRCWAQQIDAQARMESGWGEIRAYLREVFDWAGVEDLEAEELSVLPGLDEIFALTDIKSVVAAGEHDLLVVDCAPTAETIRFLSLPDVLGWYMERLFPMSRRLTRIVGPVVSRLSSGLPIADDSVFTATQRLYDRLDGVREVLTDPSVASVRIVVNAEKMVVAEAKRTFTYLSLFGYHVDAVIANRLLPDEVEDPWFDRWKDVQSGHLKSIEEGFAPVPILRAPLAASEVVGVAALGEFAAGLYGELDPAAVLHRHEPFRVERLGGEWVLSLDLPFTAKGEVDVVRIGEELVITLPPYRRTMVLPDSLRRRDIVGAAFTDGRLRVRFAG